MIGFVRGILDEVRIDSVVIDCNGIGYEVLVATNVLEQLSAEGTQIKLYTYLHVREDLMQLYGFLKKTDLDMFKLLITVNGIGPKGALGVLSVLDTQDLKFAILTGDYKIIAKAPGIGKKTAEKTVLELKDKVSLEDAFEEKLKATEEKEEAVQVVQQDAIAALVALGYNQTEALKAVRSVEDLEHKDVEAVLKESLKLLYLQ